MQDVNAKAKVLERIKKLLRVTEERGASKQEAETAWQAAQKMMQEFNLQQHEIGDVDGQKAVTFDIVAAEHRTGRRYYDLDAYVSRAVAKTCGVKMLSRSYLDAKYKKCHTYLIVGDVGDVEFVKLLIDSMCSLMIKGLNVYLKAVGRSWNAFDARGYYAGVMQGYIDAATKGQKEAAGSEKAKTSYALVLVKKDDAIIKYVGDKLSVKVKKSRARTGANDDSYKVGYKNGGSLDAGNSKLS